MYFWLFPFFLSVSPSFACFSCLPTINILLLPKANTTLLPKAVNTVLLLQALMVLLLQVPMVLPRADTSQHPLLRPSIFSSSHRSRTIPVVVGDVLPVSVSAVPWKKCVKK